MSLSFSAQIHFSSQCTLHKYSWCCLYRGKTLEHRERFIVCRLRFKFKYLYLDCKLFVAIGNIKISSCQRKRVLHDWDDELMNSRKELSDPFCRRQVILGAALCCRFGCLMVCYLVILVVLLLFDFAMFVLSCNKSCDFGKGLLYLWFFVLIMVLCKFNMMMTIIDILSCIT